MWLSLTSGEVSEEFSTSTRELCKEFRPMGEEVNGRGVWVTVGVGASMYMYYRQNTSRWVIDSKVSSAGSTQLAFCASDASGLLPSGIGVWCASNRFRGVADEGDEWMDVPLCIEEHEKVCLLRALIVSLFNAARPSLHAS